MNCTNHDANSYHDLAVTGYVFVPRKTFRPFSLHFRAVGLKIARPQVQKAAQNAVIGGIE
jgi:hypothetical protein